MRNLRTLLALVTLLLPAMVNAAATSASATIETVGTPAGFNELERPREIVSDLYFGGRKVGEAVAVVRPGFLRFRDPAKVVALIPNLVDSALVGAALSEDLPTNSGLACAPGSDDGCGRLSPDTAGIIYDEDRFRVDLFVAPKLLRAVRADDQVYLPTPKAPLSLTSSMGLAISGSSGAPTTYNVQNRTILGFHNARIRSDSGYASRQGLIVDDLVAEVDRPDLRFSGGMFWAPGLDLIGQRRIVGVGVGTQFDTRADRESLRGTPLILFLGQPARVDMLIDGRLVGSRAYDAGNDILDTSALPDGSYSLVLRIHEASGAVREERRFFVKNAQIAPVGRPLYFAYAGLLANTRRGAPISLSHTLFYQFGTARRLSSAFAVDTSIIGTQNKTMAEVGGWFITPYARVRAAGLVSTKGDRGALLQLQSAEVGRFNASFDLRRMWSHDGQPLIPLPSYLGGFDSAPPTGAQIGGSYTQASGSIGYRFGTAYLSVIGSLRKDQGERADYTVGPDVSWAIVNRQGLQLVLQANAQRTRATTAGYAGFRILSTLGRTSLISTLGRSMRSSRDGSTSDSNRSVGSLSGQYYYEGPDQTELSVGGGFDRNVDSSVGHAGGTLYTRFGNARADILHNFEGPGGSQFGITLQTGAAIDRQDVVLGGRDQEQSAVVISVDGPADYAFDLLVNDQSRGRISGGQRIPLFLQPYRAYKVRLRPLNGAAVSYDAGAREVTLYPGNVEHLRWQVDRKFTVFGRALRPDGRPVADAMIQSRRGVGESDSDGYFQIDASNGDSLQFSDSGTASCAVQVGAVTPVNDYVSLGKVVCR